MQSSYNWLKLNKQLNNAEYVISHKTDYDISWNTEYDISQKKNKKKQALQYWNN